MSAERGRPLILLAGGALLAFGALAFLSLGATATTINVDALYSSDNATLHQWMTVQKGLYDAAANDTVIIHNGTYHENVTLSKNYVTVQGESRSGVVIDRQSLGNSVFTVQGHHVVLQNLTLTHGIYGVYIDAGYHNGTLDNITVTQVNYDCIYLRQAHDWIMHDIDASSCGYGGFDFVGNPLYNIHMWSISVTTTTSYDGLYFYLVSGAWASNLTLTSTGRAAIWLQNSADLHFSNFRINTTGNYGGVYIYSTLSDSSFDNGSIRATANWAFYSYDTHSCSLDNVTLEAGSYGGFDFGGLSTGWRWRNVLINTTSSPLYFYYNSPAVLAYFQHDIDTSNTIRGVPIVYIVNATGGSFSGPASFLAVVNSTGVNVTVNTTISGLDDGVFILFTNSSTIRDINSSGNGWNFVIERSNNNTFANFSQTYMRAPSWYGGIYLYASSYNLFDGGTWRNTSLYGYAVDVRAGSGSHFNTFANVSCSGWNTCFYFGTDTEGNRLSGSSVNGPYYGVYANYAASFVVSGSTFTGVYYYAVYGYFSSATAPLNRTWIHNNTFNHTTYYYAVYLYGHAGALIENNSINDSSTAIYGASVNGLVIQNNVINASHDSGIRGDNSDYWVVSGNTLTNSTNEGIFLYRDSYWTLRSNNIPNQTQPVALSLDASIQVRWANHDVDASNTFNGLPPLWIVNASSGTFTGSYGWIVVDNSSNLSVTSTSSLARNQAGVLLVGVNDSTMSTVNATGNTWGFEAWLSARNTVSDSRFALNTAGGMYYWGSDWNTVLRATLRPDTYRADIGLDVDSGSNNLTFESGDCMQFSTCIQAQYGTANLRVLNSTLNDSYYEVYSYQFFGPWVMGNTMNFSYYYQVYLGYTSSPQTQDYRISNNTMGQAYYYDIYCYFCGRGLIEDNVLSGADYGIYLYNGQGGVVARNRIYGMVSGGIEGYFSDYRVLIDNTIANAGGASAGIRIENSKFWTLRGNNITNQTAPIRLVFSVPITDIGYGMHDVDTSNTANGYPIRFFVNATGVSFTGSAGLIIATNSSGLNITATNPISRGQGGIFLLATNWSTFSSTNLSQNEWGLVSYLSNNNTFADLTVWKNSAGGASFAYSDWNRVQGGNFTPDTPYSDAGVQFDAFARNNTVSSNISGFTEDVYMSAATAFDNGVDGGSYGGAYYGIYSYAYAGTRAEHASFSDDYYYHVYIQGGGPSTGVGRIANNTMHRTNYHSVYLYSVGAGLIADNLINGSGQEGVYLYSTTGVTVARNMFTNGTDYALYGSYSSFITVTDNVVTHTHYGVYFQESRYWTFSNNSIFNLTGSQPYAVIFSSPDPVTDETLFMHTWTSDNTINGGPVRYYVNATGVTFRGPAGWIVAVNCTSMDLGSTTLMSQNYYDTLFVKAFNSTARDSASNGSHMGAALTWGADNRVVNITANATAYGIYLSNNTRATISGVYLSNATQYGLYAYLSTRLNITNSTFFRNYYGVYLEYRSQYVNITGSLFDSQGYMGIYTEATDDVRIVGNTILSSLYYGIYLGGNSGDQANRDLVSGNRMNNGGYYSAVTLYYTYSSVVENNNITNSSSVAIELSSSNANTVRGNTLRFQYYAYYLSSADSNTFQDGTISNSTWTIYLSSSADFNLFYHNNFFTANNSMYDIGTSNAFHNGYPSGGNYWSNTTHTDLYKGASQSTAGPDGINDTSLVLPYGRVDSYPLSEPWPPYVTLVGPANGTVFRAGATLDFNISFYFDTVQVALNNGTTTNLTTPFDISTGGFADGDLFVQIWANDSTGYTQQPWFLFVIDSTSPTITADGPTVGGTYAVGTQLNFTVADAHLVANVTWNNGSGFNPLTAPWDISTAGWAEGDYNITIAAWDTAGNNASSRFLFKLDSTPPVITLNSPANNSFIAVGTTIDLTVSDVHLSSVNWDNGSGPNPLSAPWDISTAGWGSATFNITVLANDTGGLSTTRVFTFTIDATAPTITLNSPLNNSVFEPGQTLDFDVSDSNLAGATWDNGSGANAFSSPYDISTSGWADGSYNVTIRANDTSGNVAVRLFHFEVDFTAPSIVVVSPANNTFISPGTTLDFAVTDAHLSGATWTNGSATNALASPFDVSTAGWLDGNYTVTVNATDVLGHTATRNLFVKIDSIAPTITLNSPSNNSYITPGTTIDLAASDANLNTVNWTTAGAPTALASPFDISTTGWADGVYTVRVNATDLAGNLRFSSFTFTVDGSPPAITLNSPANNSYIPAGTTIDLTVGDANLNAANWTAGGAPAALASPWDISTTGWLDGAYTVRVNATDLAGNLRFSSYTFTVDSTPPAVTLNSPTNNSFITPGTTVDLSVADTNLNTVNWTTGGAPTALASPFDISTTGWADGVYTVRVNATDLAGNLRFSTFTFTVDGGPPVIVLNSPANNSYITAGTTIDLAVTDGNLNGVNWTTGGAPTALVTPFDISTVGWADGVYTVRVNATDSAGNLRFSSFTFTVDSTAPSIALNSPSNGSYIVAGATIDLSVSDTNLNTVNWTVAGAPTALASPFDISTTGWADGVYTLRVNATDLAGNRRFSSYTFTVDSNPPSITLNSPANNAYIPAGTTIDLSVADANLAAVNWTTGGTPTLLVSPFDINTTGWSDGVYTLRLNATDLAGNLKSATYGFTVDSTPPTVTLASPASGATVKAGATLDFAVADANLNTVVWDNGGTPATLASPYDIVTTSWADGTYTVTVRATDLAGNSKAVAAQIVIDSTPPTITLNSPTAGAVVVAGTTIDLTVVDTNLSAVTYANGSGPFALLAPFDISTAGWPDANYTISVHATDQAGNEAWMNFSMVIDSTVPSITLVTPANGSVVRAGTLLLWTISDANLRNVSYNNGTSDVVMGAPFQINTTGYFDRNYNITLFAADLAGNSVARLFNFTVDSTPPQVQLLSPANNTWLAGGVLIDFAVTDAHLSVVNVTLDGAPLTLFAGYDYNSTNLTDGLHTFMITATDAAGNAQQLTSVFRVDKTAPRITVNPVGGSTVQAGKPWTFTITEANLQRAEWKVAGTPSFSPFVANFTLNTTGWADGFYDYVIQAVDFAGNGVQLRTNITIDSTPPAIDSLTLLSAVHYIKRGVPIVFRVSGETSTYTAVLFLRGVPVALTDDGSGRFTFTFTTEGEDNLDYDFVFRAVDAAGNQNEVTRFVLLDNTAPQLPSTFPMAYGGNEDTPFAFNGSASDFTALASELNYTWQFDPASRLQVLTSVYGQNTTWTFTDPGQYAIDIVVTDPAGNANRTIFNITIFDITPPSLSLPVTFYNVDEDTPVNINQTSIDNGNGTLNWTWRSPAANLTSFGPNITWIFTTPGLYNISVTVTDPQNNSAVGYVVVNVRDITPPEVTLIGPTVVDVLIPALFTANVTDNDPRYTVANWTYVWTFHNATRTGSDIARSSSYVGLRGETVTVELNVTDASGNWNKIVSHLTVNEPPTIGTQPPAEVATTDPWVWTPNATDPENASVTYSIVDGPPGMTIAGGSIVWTPGAGSAGNYSVTVGISDGLTTVLRQFTVYVVDPAVLAGNHKPVFDSEPPTDARVRTPYLYDIKVHDQDGDNITIVISGLDGYSYDSGTGRLSWMPPWQPEGLEVFERLVPVTITAYDGKQSSTQEFTVRFRNPPDAVPNYIALLTINDVTQGDVVRVKVSDYWHDRDDVDTNLTFVMNDSDLQVRAKVPTILGWKVEFDGVNTWLVFNVTGTGTVTFNLVARDPSNAKSENATVTVNAAVKERAAPPGFPLWMLLLLLAGGAVGAVGLAVSLRRSRAAGEVARSALETASKAPTERVIIQQAPLAAGAEKRKDTYVIEGALIIYSDGRMVFSKLDAGDVKLEDPELVSSMFSAVQSFIKDSFQAQGELNRLGFGENTILMERGTSIFMAAIIYGEPTDEFSEAMRETIRTIENAYAGIIEDWDGSTTSLEAIDQYVEPFFALTAGRSREDVKAALTEKVVKMPSELEFFQGFVRLKCGVKNDTESVITKVTVSIDFNEDVLRLHHIEPDTYKFQGSEVQLGVLNPGEKVSVAYYFDPQICTESQIDGVGRYRDAKGAVHSISMKTRKAEVVCPIFFTKEHANTAMLKRLVEGELDQRDSKVYTVTQLPEGVKWAEVFSLAKEVVLGHDVHLVRDFVVEEPYHGEAWFYGETKVKGYKIVIRASVIADGSKLEFFAASTQIRAITGLLAEFNHTLNSLIGRKYATMKLKSEFGEEIKQDIQKKSLMGKMGQSELDGGETEQEPR